MLDLHIDGEVCQDKLHQIIYATDASVYREIPEAVVYPKDKEDIRKIVNFAREKGHYLIPRAGGTSLAGQVVGSGMVVDVSRHMNKILEINEKERWVRVQPGVVLDELNLFCKPYGLFFGPETSTSNRCCLGGMVGNNSCGSHSLVYGSTRNHLLEAKVILSDGSEAVFKHLTDEEFEEKLNLQNFEGEIYRKLNILLTNEENRQEILNGFPDRKLTRRNTGYALDELLGEKNLCKLLAGSEGTLSFVYEIKLNLLPLPPKEKAVIVVHHDSLNESFYANLVCLEHNPVAVELMDGTILELSKQNIGQSKNRFFVKGDPAAILVVELAEETREALDTKANAIIEDLKAHGYGYAYPILYGDDIPKVWNLRKAGLGLLSGIPGSAKPVALMEDTAVLPERLPDYVAEIQQMLKGYGLKCVYFAHIATGELHMRPILNLKEARDIELFRKVGHDVACIVKKHHGSLSGEHGDGRLRGEFIPIIIGERNYELLKEVKDIFDPQCIFNKGKIVNTPPMDKFFRNAPDHLAGVKTYFDYSKQKGWMCAIEQCNGSADCRKSNAFGNTMCPSFRVYRDEKNSTRARSNVLRELFQHPQSKEIFDQPEIMEALDTCLSCKACKAECPSNVDMARYKSEYLQHHYDVSRFSLRSFLFANYTRIQKLGALVPHLYNAVASNVLTSSLMKKMLNFAPERSIPRIYKTTLRKWAKGNQKPDGHFPNGEIYLFADEFTNYLDVEIGIDFIRLLNALGYKVIIPEHVESGRTEISKGFLKKARVDARKNVELLYDLISEDKPLVGIEPSCILSFRDEYPDLVGDDLKEKATALSKNVFLYDEFIVREMNKGKISADQFTDAPLNIKLHGHCHQKSLASVKPSEIMLSLPRNYHVDVIPSGCCGMAGSFGYEKEHYQMSMDIGNMVLFPTIRQAPAETVISAPGTSCRQQIKDGTGRTAYHPVHLLYKALKK